MRSISIFCIILIIGCAGLAMAKTPKEVTVIGKLYLDEHKAPSGEVYTDEFIKLLKARNQPYRIKDGTLKIICKNKIRTIENLCFCLEYYKNCMDVYVNNIGNAETTRSIDGGPYMRQYVDAADGNINIMTDTANPERKEFEPKHPDADQDGYVVYPNVNVEYEKYKLLDAENSYNLVVEVLKKIVPEDHVVYQQKNDLGRWLDKAEIADRIVECDNLDADIIQGLPSNTEGIPYLPHCHIVNVFDAPWGADLPRIDLVIGPKFMIWFHCQSGFSGNSEFKGPYSFETIRKMFNIKE